VELLELSYYGKLPATALKRSYSARTNWYLQSVRFRGASPSSRWRRRFFFLAERARNLTQDERVAGLKAFNENIQSILMRGGCHNRLSKADNCA